MPDNTDLGPPPHHVAIIMDGNGRWAQARGLPRIAGHRRGGEAVRRAVTAAGELGIDYLTLFGFSSENWKRPADEVDDLMGLLRHYLRGEIAELHRNSVRLRVIGRRERLAPDIVTLIENGEQLTLANTGLQLTVALSRSANAAGMEIVERHRHTARLEGLVLDEASDATVFWNYLDFRFRSPRRIRIGARLTATALIVRLDALP